MEIVRKAENINVTPVKGDNNGATTLLVESKGKTMEQLLVKKFDFSITNPNQNPAIVNFGGYNVILNGNYYVDSGNAPLNANITSGNFPTTNIGFSAPALAIQQFAAFCANNPVIIIGARASFDFANYPGQKTVPLVCLDNRNNESIPQSVYGNRMYVTPLLDNSGAFNQNVSDYYFDVAQIIDGHRILQYEMVAGAPTNIVSMQLAVISVGDFSKSTNLAEFMKKVSEINNLSKVCFN